MKTATAFLVAVTVFASVFLESSAAPNLLFGDIGLKLGSSVTELGKSAGNIITGAGAGVDKILGKGGELLKGSLNDAIIDLKTLIQDVDKLVKALLGEGTEAAAALGDEIVKKDEEVKSYVEELIKLVEKYVKAVTEGGVDSAKELEGLIKIVAEKLKAIVPGLVEILDQIFEKAGKDVKLIIAPVKGILAKVGDIVEGTLTKFPEGLKSKTTEDVNGVEKLDEDSLKEYVEEKMKISDVAIAKFGDAVKRFLAEKNDVEKEVLVKFYEKVVLLVEEIHRELTEDVKVKNRENRVKLVEKMSEAAKNIKAEVKELMETQGEEIKEALVKCFLENILPNAENVEMEMKKSL